MQGRTKVSAIILLSLTFILTGCISKAVYHPVKEIVRTPADAKLQYESVTMKTSDSVKISGWWIPAANARGTVLFCHGNGGNISYYLDSAVISNKLGLNILLFDYRGYGTSEGSPSERGTYLDAGAAWDYLVKTRNIPPARVIIWGRSLGGSIAAKTASLHPSGLLIIESTFTSVKDLVHERFSWVPGWVVRNYAYDTREYLKKVSAPILVIHSPDDEMIPFHYGKDLFDSIRGPKKFLEIRGSHNRGFIDSIQVYAAGTDDFISAYLGKLEAAQ